MSTKDKKQPPTIVVGKKEPVKQDNSLAVFQGGLPAQRDDIPEYLKSRLGDRSGSEGVGKDDVLVPRLCLSQEGMSPQLKKASESYIPGLESGQFFNSVTSEVYGDRLTVVPILFYKNFIEFIPMNQGGGVRAMYDPSTPPPSEKLQFGRNEKGETISPEVTEFKNRICLLIREGRQPELIVVSFKSSGIKAAKKWNSLIAATGLPAFARSYELTVVNKVRGQQTWFGMDIMPGVFVPKAFFEDAQRQFDALQSGGFKIDTSGLENDADGTGDTVPF